MAADPDVWRWTTYHWSDHGCHHWSDPGWPKTPSWLASAAAMSAPESDEEMGRQTELLAQVLADMRQVWLPKPSRSLAGASLTHRLTAQMMQRRRCPNRLPQQCFLTLHQTVPRLFQTGPSFVGCLMSPLCGDSRDSLGFHKLSSHSGTKPSRAAS